MKKITSYMILFLTALFFSACQDKDAIAEDAHVQPVAASDMKCSLVGDDYVIQWPALPEGYTMTVTRYANNVTEGSETVKGNTYTHSSVETNVPYMYILKVSTTEYNATKGENMEYQSTGTILYYTRNGASSVTGLSMAQVDKVGGYDASVTWNAVDDATSILLTAATEDGSRTINETLSGDATSYTIEDVKDGETWDVTVVASNDEGKSLAATSSLRIGKTLIGFLGVYDNADKCVQDGDDDEASAWLWLHNEYPSAQYISFKDITSADQLNKYRVLFWLRDLEGVGESEVLNMPDVVKTAAPYIKEWYKNGGNLLLWQHAMPFVETLGRIPAGTIQSNDRNISTGVGGWNGDTWRMAVCLHPGSKFKKDASSHPLFKGLETETTDRTVLIAFKGPGWTEDHNCLFFNYPSKLTGKGNQDEACYNELVNTYGIIPLGTWDSQIDWVSQLNVWEAQQGNTEFKGTILCIGNGGCEFSMKNADGTADKSAYPKNNCYQGNVLRLAKNALEYLKTR